MMQRKTSALWIAFLGMSLSQLALGIGITGTVVDYRGLPVEKAEVVVFEVTSINREDHVNILTSPVFTDSKGTFAIDQPFHTRNYSYIVARKSGLALAWDCINSYGKTTGRASFSLVLEKPGSFQGTVVDAKGQPVSGAHVQAVPKTFVLDRLDQNPILGPESWMSTQTDDQGVFSFNQFGMDVSADFEVTTPQTNSRYQFTPHYTSSCGFEVGRTDIHLSLPEEHGLHGCVLNPEGSPVPHVELVVGFGGSIRTTPYDYRSRIVTSDGQGRFHCQGLPTGKVLIKLSDAEQDKGVWALKPKSVDFQPEPASDPIQVTLEPCATLEFTVREKKTERPLSDFYVRGWGDDYFFIKGLDHSGFARVHLPPGEYRYGFWHKRPYSSWDPGVKATVEAGQTQRIPINLNPCPQLSGKVIRPNGEAAPGVLIKTQAYGNEVYTDTKGHFQVEWSGEDCEIVALDTPAGLIAYEQVEDPNTALAIQLEPAFKFTGKAIAPNGDGIPGARIQIYNSWSGRLGDGEVLTDPTGCFQWLGPPTQEEDLQVRVSITASGYVPVDGHTIELKRKPERNYDLDSITVHPANLSISGVIVDANGLPVPRMVMFLNGDSGIDQQDKTSATDDQGRFQFNRIGPGRLRIQLDFSNSETGHGWLYCHAGDHDIKAVSNQTNVHEPFQVLTNTLLPDLTSLSPDLGQALQPDCPALLCFVDIELRTARHCLSQLAKQLDHFNEQGLQVLIIQMSPADLSSYQDWLDKNGITQPIYPVKGDLVQKKYDWGVKSLPWLILTDKSHKVVAEGLSLTDVMERL